ncbi:MAG: O-antigen ligase family protein [Burkholderiales bacterium]
MALNQSLQSPSKSIAIPGIGFALIAALYFVWPIPHTITLRFVLLGATLLYFGLLVRGKCGDFRGNRQITLLVALYLALSAWIVINALLISPEPAWALGEIQGQWGNAALSLVAGVLISAAVQRRVISAPGAVMAILIALAMHTLYLDASSLHAWFTKGVLLRRSEGLTEGPDKSNYLTIAFLGFLFSEVYYRSVQRSRFVPVNRWLLGGMIALGLFAFYLEEMRNGLAPIILVLVSFLALYILDRRDKIKSGRLMRNVVLLACLAGAFGLFIVKSDPRWHNIEASAKLAWQTQDNSAWLNDDPAHQQKWLPDGHPVEASTYLRTVMLKEGLQIVAAHPFGVGYGRNAFGHALKAKYGQGSGHSHSGLLDLATGVGIPGVVLWLALLGYAAYVGAAAFLRHNSYPALALLALVITFGVRMVFDSVIRDHMLQQFMFTAALLVTLALPRALEGKPA